MSMLSTSHVPNKLIKEVKGKYTYITVDEYQDVNPIQEELIRLLTSDKRNLCVVGDDDPEYVNDFETPFVRI